jgi:hypothetical protein
MHPNQQKTGCNRKYYRNQLIFNLTLVVVCINLYTAYYNQCEKMNKICIFLTLASLIIYCLKNK